MSMDKEELYALLKTSHLSEWCAILYAVIALVEIRESIDDLRSEVTEMNALNSQLFREMLIQHDPANDHSGKDIRSAGLG